MKELKQNLKKASMVFSVRTEYLKTLSGQLIIKLPDDKYINIKCQSHIPDTDRKKEACFRDFGSRYIGFYAARIDCEARFCANYDFMTPEKSLKFMAWVREQSDKLNLQYKYPDCEISRIIDVLENHGIPMHEITVDKKPFRDWKTEQIKRQEELVQ